MQNASPAILRTMKRMTTEEAWAMRAESERENAEIEKEASPAVLVLILSVSALFLCLLLISSDTSAIRGAVFIGPSSYTRTVGIITQSDLSICKYRTNINYGFNISYSYSVEGKAYTGNRVLFGSSWRPYKSFSEAYIRKYPVGYNVSVFYKSDEPSFAVLEPNNVGGVRSTFGFFVAAMALSIFGLSWSVKKLRRINQTTTYFKRL